jgi:hypothetical protein
VSVWSFLKLTVCLWLVRKAAKITGWVLLAAVVLAAWPLTVITVTGYVAAWWRGWPPARLRRMAAWSLVMLPVWLAAAAVRVRLLRAAALAGARAWAHDWPHPAVLAAARTFVLLAPATVPAGLVLAAGVWAWRNYAITTGLGGITASAPITFDRRQWKRQARTAKGLTEAPGAVPLAGRGGKIPVGATIRAIGHRWHPVFALPARACARHMVIVGATGSGKTNLMMRLQAGWFTAILQAAVAGRGNPPLLVVLDCKGGQDARRKAGRTRRLLYGAGARRVAVWPDEARLSLWDLPARDLAVLLYQMIETGTGAAAYYADILQAVLTLAATAPAGPPADAAGFLDRLEARWLTHAWSGGRHPAQVARVQAAARHLLILGPCRASPVHRTLGRSASNRPNTAGSAGARNAVSPVR